MVSARPAGPPIFPVRMRGPDDPVRDLPTAIDELKASGARVQLDAAIRAAETFAAELAGVRRDDAAKALREFATKLRRETP